MDMNTSVLIKFILSHLKNALLSFCEGPFSSHFCVSVRERGRGNILPLERFERKRKRERKKKKRKKKEAWEGRKELENEEESLVSFLEECLKPCEHFLRGEFSSMITMVFKFFSLSLFFFSLYCFLSLLIGLGMMSKATHLIPLVSRLLMEFLLLIHFLFLWFSLRIIWLCFSYNMPYLEVMFLFSFLNPFWFLSSPIIRTLIIHN